MRESPRKIKNVELWDKSFVKRAKNGYSRDKRKVNKSIRQNVNAALKRVWRDMENGEAEEQ